MIFPEMVRVFLKGSFIYLFLIERWPKCADLWTFGKDWWVSFFSLIFQTINTTALLTRPLRKP